MPESGVSPQHRIPPICRLVAIARPKTARHLRIGPIVIDTGLRSRLHVGNEEPSRAALVLAGLMADLADRPGLYFLMVYVIRK